jgi:tRNA(Ile)-lysidine synthase
MERRWSPSQQATLPLPNNGSLVVGALTGAGRRGGIAAGPCRLSPDLAPLTVRYRRGGEVLRLARRPGKSLKKLQQEFQVPPWLRHRQPLLFYGTHLVAVPGIGVAEAFVVAPDQPALAISWEAPDLLFGAGW